MSRRLRSAALGLAAVAAACPGDTPSIGESAPQAPCDRPAWQGWNADPLDLLAGHLVRGSSRARHFATARLAEGGIAGVKALESMRAASLASRTGNLVDTNICDALALMESSAQSLALLRRLVLSPIGLVQIKASRALAARGEPADVILLSSVFEEAQGSHRRALMAAIALAGDSSVLFLEGILARPSDQDLHDEALLRLASLDAGRDSDPVQARVGGVDLLSLKITSALAAAGDPRAIAWLVQHAQDSAPEVRTAAGLGLYGLWEAWDLVARSPETSIKRACLAAWPLGDEAPAVLRSYLDDPDPAFRTQARKAFALHKDQPFLDSLLERLRRPGLTPRGLGELVSLLADPQVKEVRALDTLLELAGRAPFRNQQTVWQALSSLGGTRAARTFADALADSGLTVAGLAATEVLPALAIGVGEAGVAVYRDSANRTADPALRKLLLSVAVGCGGDAAAALLMDRVLDESESPSLRAHLIARWPAVCRGTGLSRLAAALPLMDDPVVQQHLNCLLWEYY